MTRLACLSFPLFVALVLAGCGQPPAPAPHTEAPATPPPEAPAAPPPAPTPTPPQAEPVTLPPFPWKPCELTVERRVPGEDTGCVQIPFLQAGGEPVGACLGGPATLRFVYDASGRIVDAPGQHYVYAADGTATRTSAEGHAVALQFDAQGRITRSGETTFRYDDQGRRTEAHAGDHVVHYRYEADGTFQIDHDYPDTDEFCEQRVTEVRRDAEGRLTRQSFGDCQINYTPYTLELRYAPSGALDRIDVDLQSDGTIDGAVRVRLDC